MCETFFAIKMSSRTETNCYLTRCEVKARQLAEEAHINVKSRLCLLYEVQVNFRSHVMSLNLRFPHWSRIRGFPAGTKIKLFNSQLFNSNVTNCSLTNSSYTTCQLIVISLPYSEGDIASEFLRIQDLLMLDGKRWYLFRDGLSWVRVSDNRRNGRKWEIRNEYGMNSRT